MRIRHYTPRAVGQVGVTLLAQLHGKPSDSGWPVGTWPPLGHGEGVRNGRDPKAPTWEQDLGEGKQEMVTRVEETPDSATLKQAPGLCPDCNHSRLLWLEFLSFGAQRLLD